MKYIEGVGEMPNGQAGDVEALRRELADLIVQWAGKSVKDDPDGPLGAALTRAVREAAREAVSEQHQALSRRDAEGIAEAVARLSAERPGAGGALALPHKTLLAICAAVVAVAASTFVLGLQVGRAGAAPDVPVEPALSAAAATPFAPSSTPSAAIAPQAPAAEPASARVPAAPTGGRATARVPAPPRRPAPSGPTGRPAPAAPTDTGGQPVTGARAPAPTAAAPSAPAAAP